ncbi:CueP family metal-binding protein [Mycoplasmatota bacterium]|nr:CueP family metal-binding protein [Mycoplasmatota bacterium]
MHSATGCRAELVEKRFEVIVKDSYGKEIFNNEVTSLRNGFFELWLPREIEGTITVNYNGLSSTSTISTFDGDLTCLTTMELR